MGMMGPAALIFIKPNEGEETRFWIFQNRQMIQERFPGILGHNPKLNAAAFKPYTFFLDDLDSRFYTGLQVNRDPGVPLVWSACFLMVAGFVVTFFTSHRRIWVRLAKEKKGTRISVAGTASKNPVGLERELERLTKDIGKLFGKKYG
jgi:cytochrome c biogenesis protein